MTVVQVLSEGLNWMKSAIQAFGLGPWIDTRKVIDWTVEELGNTIPAVKNAAVALIGTSESQPHCLNHLDRFAA